MAKRLFNHSSFWALNANEQATVRAAVRFNATSSVPSIPYSYRHRNTLVCACEDAAWRLARIDASLLPFLTPSQQQALEGELLYAFYLFSAAYKLDEVEKAAKACEQGAARLKQCAYLLQQLRPQSPPIRANLSADIADMPQEIAQKVRQELSAFNARRLYWVWGGSLVGALLGVLKGVGDLQQVSFALQCLSSVTAPISWILYFTRFGIVCGDLLAHVLSENERASGLTWQARLQAQWRLHKYTLLNDSIWGLCNLACAVLLYGTGLFGFLGNVLTAVLLTMDMSLTFLAQYEQQQECQREQRRFSADKARLQRKINVLEADGSPSVEVLQVLRQSLAELERSALHSQRTHKYKQWNAYLDFAYALALLIAFCAVCCFFSPALLALTPVASVLTLVSTVVCFSLNVLYAGLNTGFKIAKAHEIARDEVLHLDALLMRFVALAEQNPEDNQLGQLYFACLVSAREREQALREANHQLQVLLFSLGRDLLIPPLFIVSLACLPLAFGIPLLVTSIVLLFCLSRQLMAMSPDRLPPVVIAPAELQAACANPKSFARAAEGWFNKSRLPENQPASLLTQMAGVVPE